MTLFLNMRTYIKGKRVAEIRVLFYREEDGTSPILKWLDKLPTKVQLKCLTRIERLKQEGHALRRPEADF